MDLEKGSSIGEHFLEDRSSSADEDNKHLGISRGGRQSPLKQEDSQGSLLGRQLQPRNQSWAALESSTTHAPIPPQAPKR